MLVVARKTAAILAKNMPLGLFGFSIREQSFEYCRYLKEGKYVLLDLQYLTKGGEANNCIFSVLYLRGKEGAGTEMSPVRQRRESGKHRGRQRGLDFDNNQLLAGSPW